MPKQYRAGFYLGLVLAIATSFYLLWLWRPQRQVQRHTQNLLRALERKDWARLGDFIAPDYRDQWQNDRALLVERTRETFRYVRSVKLTAQQPTIHINNGTAHWEAQIIVKGDPGEVMTIIQDRVNSLTTPFDLEWRHFSGKPWDWKLVHVSNPALDIPEFAE